MTVNTSDETFKAALEAYWMCPSDRLGPRLLAALNAAEMVSLKAIRAHLDSDEYLNLPPGDYTAGWADAVDDLRAWLIRGRS